MHISDEDIERGFAHLETIANIHYGESPTEYADALQALGEYLGMDEEAQRKLIQRAHAFVPSSRGAIARSWVIIGVLVGMAATQYAAETI